MMQLRIEYVHVGMVMEHVQLYHYERKMTVTVNCMIMNQHFVHF